MITVVLPIVVILVLVIVNGVFVAAEFALVGARRSRIESLAEGGSRVARWLLGVFDHPTGKDGYIAVAQLGITLASVGLGMYGEPAVAKWLYEPLEDAGLSYGASHTVGFVVALSAITFLHVVFGEMIPKALALQSPEGMSLRVNPVMRFFGLVFKPMVHVLNVVALALLRLLRIPEPDQRMALYTSAELEIVSDEAAESGQLGMLQRELIRNIFDLDERVAEELMTPRFAMDVIDLGAGVAEIDALIDSSTRSRYPVVDGGLDDVVGVLHVKDFIHAAAGSQPFELAGLLRHLPTVTATASAEQLLERFKSERTHAILVVDEHGGTLGLVTLDDVIAEVMEDRTDGRDVVRNDDGTFTVAGGVTLADLRDHHGMDLDHRDVTTIAGLVLAVHGAIPEPGTTVSFEGHELVVESVDGRRVTVVGVRVPTD